MDFPKLTPLQLQNILGYIALNLLGNADGNGVVDENVRYPSRQEYDNFLEVIRLIESFDGETMQEIYENAKAFSEEDKTLESLRAFWVIRGAAYSILERKLKLGTLSAQEHEFWKSIHNERQNNPNSL